MQTYGFNKSIYNRSVFKDLSVIVKNQFPYGENEWRFYFRNLTVALYCKALYAFVFPKYPHRDF